MKFSIAQPELLRALSRLQGITDKRSTMPILSHVLLETTEEGLQLSATDLEIGIISKCECEVSQTGSLAVASKQLHEIVRTLPNKEVHFTLMDNWWLNVQCGRSEFKIVGLNPIDFPRVTNEEKVESVNIKARTLAKMIERTIFCTSQDETRQHLRGVYVEWDGEISKLRMAATDGHRLALSEETLQECPEIPSVIVPRKAFVELRRILSEVEEDSSVKLGFSEKKGHVTVGDSFLTITLIEGKFPNYKRVIPTGNEQIMRANRSDFISALKRISILSRDQENTVTITPQEGSVTISAQNPDLGEAHEDLESEYQGSSFSACFNARYMLDVLNLVPSDVVQIEMADEISPTLIRSPENKDFLSVVMPMRP